jgi:hypothetical protein
VGDVVLAVDDVDTIASGLDASRDALARRGLIPLTIMDSQANVWGRSSDERSRRASMVAPASSSRASPSDIVEPPLHVGVADEPPKATDPPLRIVVADEDDGGIRGESLSHAANNVGRRSGLDESTGSLGVDGLGDNDDDDNEDLAVRDKVQNLKRRISQTKLERRSPSPIPRVEEPSRECATLTQLASPWLTLHVPIPLTCLASPRLSSPYLASPWLTSLRLGLPCTCPSLSPT